MGHKRSHSASLSPEEESEADPSTPSSLPDPSVHVKLVHLHASPLAPDLPALMKCSLPPHGPLSFSSFDEYDVHYQKTHMNRCADCHRNFPDQHFLGLHIAENHDPIRAARKDRGEKTFACLVPDCDRLCSTPHKRRLHCIDKHQFPRNYDFYIINDGIDRRSSMLRPPHRRRSSTVTSTTSTAGRRRGESTSAGDGEAMDVVEDDDTEEGGDDEVEVEGRADVRSPVKLRGRGGFTHPRRGRGRGRGTSTSAPQASASSSAESAAKTTDPMDSLTSSMSALQFVPHSLYSRGRGRGRGG